MPIDPTDDRGKATKAEAQYGPGGRDHCGICRYFLELTPRASVGACTKVRGPIRPQDWCRYYQLGRRPDGATWSEKVPPLAVGAKEQDR